MSAMVNGLPLLILNGPPAKFPNAMTHLSNFLAPAHLSKLLVYLLAPHT